MRCNHSNIKKRKNSNSRNTVIRVLCRFNPFKEYYRFNEIDVAAAPKPYFVRVGEKTAYKCHPAAVAWYLKSNIHYHNRIPFQQCGNRVSISIRVSLVFSIARRSMVLFACFVRCLPLIKGYEAKIIHCQARWWPTIVAVTVTDKIVLLCLIALFWEIFLQLYRIIDM